MSYTVFLRGKIFTNSCLSVKFSPLEEKRAIWCDSYILTCFHVRRSSVEQNIFVKSGVRHGIKVYIRKQDFMHAHRHTMYTIAHVLSLYFFDANCNASKLQFTIAKHIYIQFSWKLFMHGLFCLMVRWAESNKIYNVLWNYIIAA